MRLDLVLRRLRSTPMAVRHVVLAFVVARFLTLFGAWVISGLRPELGLTEILTDWDGNFYKMIAQDLYQPVGGTWEEPELKLAFFPVLPVVVHVLHLVSGVGVHVLGPLVSIVVALFAFVALVRHVARKFGDAVATATCALMLFSPNAFVLSMFYTEGLFLLIAVLVFDKLDKKQWAGAGLLALIGGLVRPSGFVLFVPCVIAAIDARRREPSNWRMFVAPVLAPLGFIAWVAYVAQRTGEPFGYFSIQSEVWGARIDGGAAFLRGLVDLFDVSDHNLDVKMSVAAGLILGLGGLALSWKQKVDATYIGYSVALVALTIFNERQSSGWRFLLPAFPLFLAWSRVIPKWMLPTLVALGGGVGAVLFHVSIVEALYTP